MCVYRQCFSPADALVTHRGFYNDRKSQAMSNLFLLPGNTVSDRLRIQNVSVPKKPVALCNFLDVSPRVLACSSVYQGKVDAACHLVVILIDMRQFVLKRLRQ